MWGKKGWIVAATALVGLVGCSEGPLGLESRPEFFLAEVNGSEEVGFNGVGHFIDSGVEEERGREFSLSAVMEENGKVSSILVWTYEGPPAVGTYPIGLPGGSGGARHHLGFYRTSNGDHHGHVAAEGELEITAVAGDRFEGRFRFTGFQYCTWDGVGEPVGPCRPPSEPMPGAPSISGHGTFSVGPVGPGEDEPTLPR